MIDMSKYKFYTTGNKVIAVSTYAGRTVRGVAKCDSRDTFDLEKGKSLAAARCNEKVASKRLARAAKKADEAERLLKMAQKHYDKMKDYVFDSNIALNDAELHTNSIIETM